MLLVSVHAMNCGGRLGEVMVHGQTTRKVRVDVGSSQGNQWSALRLVDEIHSAAHFTNAVLLLQISADGRSFEVDSSR